MGDRPLILITNDDGINSPGLAAAAFAAKEHGDLLIVAPWEQQTSMSRSLPRMDNLGVIEKTEITLPDGSKQEAYSAHGAPAHCVFFAMLDIAERKPDLIVSGINYGLNVASSIGISGTLGAASQGVGFGLPALAFSVETGDDIFSLDKLDHMALAAESCSDWIGHILDYTYYKREPQIKPGMPHRFLTYINVNVPIKAKDKDYEYTFCSNQPYYLIDGLGNRDISKPYEYSVKIKLDYDKLEEGSDLDVICVKNKISVTPITLDFTRWEGSRF